jgi:hypothetical protein
MHRCVKKNQNVRIRDPSVPHFPYVGSENRLFEVPIQTQWLDMRPSRIVQSNIAFIFSYQRTIGSFLFWCFQFKFGIRKSPVPVILWNSCNEPKEPVLKPPRVCYPSLISAPTLGCGDNSNPNTFHIGTSIEFGDLNHPGPGWPERRA